MQVVVLQIVTRSMPAWGTAQWIGRRGENLSEMRGVVQNEAGGPGRRSEAVRRFRARAGAAPRRATAG
jgi:hypothetical protein